MFILNFGILLGDVIDAMCSPLYSDKTFKNSPARHGAHLQYQHLETWGGLMKLDSATLSYPELHSKALSKNTRTSTWLSVRALTQREAVSKQFLLCLTLNH